MVPAQAGSQSRDSEARRRLLEERELVRVWIEREASEPDGFELVYRAMEREQQQ